MKKFEYHIVIIPDINQIENVLNDLGKNGWEMVGCGTQHEGSTHIIYLKREII